MGNKGSLIDLAKSLHSLSSKLNNASSELISEKMDVGVELSGSEYDALLEALVDARNKGDEVEEEIIINEMDKLDKDRKDIERDFINKIINKKISNLFSF